jgi:hypothetical protein
VEICIATVGKHTFLRPVLGDFLVVLLLYSIGRLFFKGTSVTLGIGVLLVAYTVEVLQWGGLSEKLGLSHTLFGQLVLGASFDWCDLLAYTLGTCLAVVLDCFLRKRLPKAHTTFEEKH